jgi:hypothetical protein
MSTKDDLTTEFTEAKWDAEAILDRIMVTSTMTPGAIQAAQGLAESVNATYLKMNRAFNRIKSLQDSSISGDVRGRLNDCSDQLTAMVPATAATGPPPTSSPDPTHQEPAGTVKGLKPR